jgi:hypothetical protein
VQPDKWETGMSRNIVQYGNAKMEHEEFIGGEARVPKKVSDLFGLFEWRPRFVLICADAASIAYHSSLLLPS